MQYFIGMAMIPIPYFCLLAKIGFSIPLIENNTIHFGCILRNIKLKVKGYRYLCSISSMGGQSQGAALPKIDMPPWHFSP
jgi:hypothetical protein